MIGARFRPLVHGQLDVSEVRRLARAVESDQRVTSDYGRANNLAASQALAGQTAAGLQLATTTPLVIWARITGPPVGNPPRHPFQQIREIPDEPGEWEDYTPDGLNGTTNVGEFPAYELNDLEDDLTDSRERLYLGAGSYWLFQHGSGTGGANALRFIKCLAELPTGGLYAGRYQNENDDGTLEDDGHAVRMREANLAPALINGEIYLCRKTGRADGYDVWTVADYNLTIENLGYGSPLGRVYEIEMDSTPTPYNTALGDWSINKVTPNDRRTRWRLNGFTGTEEVVYRVVCSGTSITVNTKYWDIRNGSVKTISGASGSPGSETGYEGMTYVLGIEAFLGAFLSSLQVMAAPQALAGWGVGKDESQQVLAGQIFGC